MSSQRSDVADGMFFAGRVALVTGCGSRGGIGFACARELARRGARVAITATTERIHERAAELADEGHDVLSWVADLTEGAQVKALVEATVGRFGQIDALVNNAGMLQTGHTPTTRAFLEMDEEDWRRALALNLTSAFLVTRAVAPLMAARGYGRIALVSSVTGPVVAIGGEMATRRPRLACWGSRARWRWSWGGWVSPRTQLRLAGFTQNRRRTPNCLPEVTRPSGARVARRRSQRWSRFSCPRRQAT